MIRVLTTALVLSAFLACGGGPSRQPSSLYTIKSTLADPSNRSATIAISVDPRATEGDLKAAAEHVIAAYKVQYPSITVKAYLSSADSGGLPYGTSVLEGGVIIHSFNPQVAPEKIKTH